MKAKKPASVDVRLPRATMKLVTQAAKLAETDVDTVLKVILAFGILRESMKHSLRALNKR